MKTMTCRELGGACDKEFHAETFEELVEMSKTHGMEMFHEGDLPHLQAMEKMQNLVNNPKDMKEWMIRRREDFDALPED